MSRIRGSPNEVMAEMHKAGLEALANVKWAILETDGSIAIVAADACAFGPATHGSQHNRRP